jgi:Flp pilus assembly pilin Flp
LPAPVAQNCGMACRSRIASLPSELRSRMPALHSEDGQALVEYALILLLIATVAVGVLTTLGLNVSTIIEQMANGLPGS